MMDSPSRAMRDMMIGNIRSIICRIRSGGLGDEVGAPGSHLVPSDQKSDQLVLGKI